MTNRSSSHRWVYFFIQNGFAANASILSYFKGSWGLFLVLNNLLPLGEIGDGVSSLSYFAYIIAYFWSFFNAFDRQSKYLNTYQPISKATYQLRGHSDALDSFGGLRHPLSCMENTTTRPSFGDIKRQNPVVQPVKVKYCLYARKSTESEERQVLSIDSQIKEMLQLADREGLEIVEMKRESHSAKETGTRPVFNERVEDLRAGKYNGILTWAPDRISRNAGDLGKIVDLMDAGGLQEIRTHGQSFRNNPNEKFLLMILGSQAKLENDNRGVNVKRGLRTRCEMGLRPGVAPVGYSNEKHMDRKCHAVVDTLRA